MAKLPRTIFKSGTANPSARINWEVVNFIRDNYRPHEVTVPMLAAETGISQPHIRKIIKGIRWANGIIRHSNNRFLNDAQVREVWRLKKMGYGYKRIGKILGVEGPNVVRPILQGKTYKGVR